MTAHPMTHRARLLAEEYDGDWLILSLCDALGGMQEQLDAEKAFNGMVADAASYGDCPRCGSTDINNIGNCAYCGKDRTWEDAQ